jgi:hypothetical protein
VGWRAASHAGLGRHERGSDGWGIRPPFVGDYEGLAHVGDTFVPFFVQANSGNTANPSDVFVTQATP